VEKQLERERNPEEIKRLQTQRENLRLRLLRRAILMQRNDLKKLETEDYIKALQAEKKRGTPLSPDESRKQRRDGLIRRLDRAEHVFNLIKGYQNSAGIVIQRRGFILS